ILRANASASSRSVPGATTRLMRPMRCASSAPTRSPVKSISMACLRATLRESATIGVEQNRPILTPGVAKWAADEATARSQLATSWQPAAVATPCTAAITGCGRRTICCIAELQALMTCVKKARPPSGSARCAVSSLRSCPAENAGPSAAITTPRTDLSAAMAVRASASAPIKASDRLLRAAGRFRVRIASGPSISRSSTGVAAGRARALEAVMAREPRWRTDVSWRPVPVHGRRLSIAPALASREHARPQTAFAHRGGGLDDRRAGDAVKPPVLATDELARLLAAEFPQVWSAGNGLAIEAAWYGGCRLRQAFREQSLRPGATISGATIMALGDYAVYVALLASIGWVP